MMCVVFHNPHDSDAINLLVLRLFRKATLTLNGEGVTLHTQRAIVYWHNEINYVEVSVLAIIRLCWPFCPKMLRAFTLSAEY